jgi:acetyl esterase/lipase
MRKTLLAATVLAACGPDTQVYEGVSYDERFGDATAMDIHVPEGGGDARPAVMLIHGGAWRFGSRDGYTEAAERFAAAGYVAATISYRLVPAGTYPAAVQDALCALSFLRAHAADYGIDPDRIAVTGYSAGGHLSALIGVAHDNPAHQPDCEWGPTAAPAAVIPGDGPYDFTAGTDVRHEWVTDFLGGTIEEVPQNYVDASPLPQVREGAPPMLVVHGHDDVVPVEGAVDLVDALRSHGNQVRFLDLEGAGHVLSPTTATDGGYLQTATDMPEAWTITLDFLSRTLGASR